MKPPPRDSLSALVVITGTLVGFTAERRSLSSRFHRSDSPEYAVMTPSAARGVLEAIFWKPEFSWQVREIHVLNEIKHFSILRNEVNSKASASSAKAILEKGGNNFAEDDRAQRHTLALRDVAYIIKADAVLRPRATDPVIKYREQFLRRVSRGQCHHAPCLGCREFAAFFGDPDGSERPIALTDDLGRMLFDLDYEQGVSGRGKPRFFAARLDKGILRVPSELYRKEA